jgi:hypothetical protein
MPTSGYGRLRRDGGVRTLKLRNEANSPEAAINATSVYKWRY